MAKKKKKKHQSVHKAIKAKLREQMLEVNAYQRTTQKVEKSKKTYTRKNQKPPDTDE
jgi:hypothetical protein